MRPRVVVQVNDEIIVFGFEFAYSRFYVSIEKNHFVNIGIIGNEGVVAFLCEEMQSAISLLFEASDNGRSEDYVAY